MLDYSVQYEVKMVECTTWNFQGTKGLFPSSKDSRKRRVQSMAHKYQVFGSPPAGTSLSHVLVLTSASSCVELTWCSSSSSQEIVTLLFPVDYLL